MPSNQPLPIQVRAITASQVFQDISFPLPQQSGVTIGYDWRGNNYIDTGIAADDDFWPGKFEFLDGSRAFVQNEFMIT
jgi:hypothetical protein